MSLIGRLFRGEPLRKPAVVSVDPCREHPDEPVVYMWRNGLVYHCRECYWDAVEDDVYWSQGQYR